MATSHHVSEVSRERSETNGLLMSTEFTKLLKKIAIKVWVIFFIKLGDQYTVDKILRIENTAKTVKLFALDNLIIIVVNNKGNSCFPLIVFKNYHILNKKLKFRLRVAFER